MENGLFENTKTAAYHLWNLTGCQNTVDLWYCAEDIALFLDKSGAYDISVIERVINMPYNDESYINFLRNIAFRLHVYTGSADCLKNWYDAESLVRNLQWAQCQVNMAQIMAKSKDEPSVISDWVKNSYLNNQ